MFQRNQEENFVYVVFIVTNTNIGKMIRLFTRNQFSHVTLAFDQDLRKMYSFARYRINSPISGGFVVEQPKRYLMGNKDVFVKICKLTISQEEHRYIQTELSYFNNNKEEMIYNTLNAVLSLWNKKIDARNTYTCLEFVTHLLHMENVMSIRQLEQSLDQYLIYQGSLKKIARMEQYFEDEFFQKRHVFGVFVDTVYHFKRVIGRALGF